MREYFERLGLTKYQSMALASLMGKKNTTGLEISAASRIPITKIYSVLLSLEEMGLVESSLERPKKFNIKPMDHVVNFLVGKYENRARMIRKVGREMINTIEKQKTSTEQMPVRA